MVPSEGDEGTEMSAMNLQQLQRQKVLYHTDVQCSLNSRKVQVLCHPTLRPGPQLSCQTEPPPRSNGCCAVDPLYLVPWWHLSSGTRYLLQIVASVKHLLVAWSEAGKIVRWSRRLYSVDSTFCTSLYDGRGWICATSHAPR